VLLVIACSLLLCSCGGPNDPVWATRLQLRRIHAAVDRFARDRARLPSALPEICVSGVDPCQLLPGGRWASDGWGNPIVIVPRTGTQYVLRSAGKDGTWDTSDDVVFDTREEQLRLAQFAGCYSVTVVFRGGVTIDTLVLLPDPTPFGEYALRPSLTGYAASWAPITGESALAVWSDGGSGFTLLAKAQETGLRGRAGTFDDLRGGRMADQEFVARRISCPS
jgi:hypothetical protein